MHNLKTRTYRPEIDGLRGLAILMVVFYHADFIIFDGGYIGVDIFFIISGYLITNVIIVELNDGNFKLRTFYLRRARRILPALFLVIILFSPFALILFIESEFKEYTKSVVALITFVSNIYFWRTSGYFSSDIEFKPLMHTWSLCVEEQFYILYPIFFKYFTLVCKRRPLVYLTMILIIAFVISIIIFTYRPAAAYFLLPARVWEFLVGSLASYYIKNNMENKVEGRNIEILSLIGFLLIIISACIFNKYTQFPGYAALIPSLGTFLIIVFSTSNTYIGRLLGYRYLSHLGMISYGIYLWHQPLFALARQIFQFNQHPSTFIIMSILSIYLAHFSWTYVEKRFRDTDVIPNKEFSILCFGAAIIFIVIGTYTSLNTSLEKRIPEHIKKIELASLDINPRQSVCHISSYSPPLPGSLCTFGDGKIEAVLLGDSHADSIAFTLSQAITKLDLKLTEITYSGCPPIENVFRSDQGRNHKCLEYNFMYYNYILSNPNVKYIILSARWSAYYEQSGFDNKEGGREQGINIKLEALDSSTNFTKEDDYLKKKTLLNQYVKSIEKLLHNNKQVILVYPIPEVGVNVPKAKARSELIQAHATAITTNHEVYKARHRAVISAFDSIQDQEGLIRIKPELIFCDTFVRKRCATENNGQIFYYDDNHLSNAGAKLITNEIISRLY